MVNNLRHELQLIASNQQVTIVTSTKSGESEYFFKARSSLTTNDHDFTSSLLRRARSIHYCISWEVIPASSDYQRLAWLLSMMWFFFVAIYQEL
uniref:Uncharacterized protein n=1 Tax=Tanacetum cinerariifolium TaxID=118510 RepID=A0A6L2L8Y9_TANCI|nr:hypothetical protein CTI12_AA054220 [Tanacetum cinerariifolium]